MKVEKCALPRMACLKKKTSIDLPVVCVGKED